MKITDIEYIIKDKYPLMKAKIDGKEALISAEQKPTLLENGIACTGLEESFSVEFNGDRFPGCTDDIDVYQAVKTFVKAAYEGPYEPGKKS